jgi:hypothetical protein
MASDWNNTWQEPDDLPIVLDILACAAIILIYIVCNL